MRDPTIFHFTIATKPHPNLERIQRVAENNMDILDVLGTHENCVKRDIFGFKLRYLNDYLRDKLDDDIILYTDAYDVVYTGPLEEIEERFKALDVPVLFGAERGCWPDSWRAFQYPTRGKDFPFLNAGAFIGYAKVFRGLLRGHTVDEGEDDQRFWTTLYLEGRGITLDHDNVIFFNGFEVKPSEFRVEARKFYYKDANPLVIHFNGESKQSLEPVWGKILGT